MSRLSRRAVGAGLTALMVAALSFNSPVSANGRGGGGGGGGGSSTGSFSCRASLLRVDGKGLLGAVHLEPVVANRPGQPCSSEDAGLLNEEFDLKFPDLEVALKLLWADTYNKSGHKAVAETGVAEVRVVVAGVPVEVEILTAEAGAVCRDNAAVLKGRSNVVHVRVGGIEVDVPHDQDHKDIPLIGHLGVNVGTLHLNHQVVGTNQVTQQALFLDTFLADVVIAEAIADVHGNPCDGVKPPKPPKQHRGWMTGGGRVGDVSHGMRLECGPADGSNNLQVSWGNEGGFHLESVTSNVCDDDLTIEPGHPGATFDWMQGSGTGRCRGGGSATATWTRISDAGEPGTGDYFAVTITGDCAKSVAGYLDGGNHQAHKRFV